jgi:hypothetical protein
MLNASKSPDDIALARCRLRNGQPGAFIISESGFWELKARFDPPAPDETPEIVQSS